MAVGGPDTLLGYILKTVGFRKGRKIGLFIAAWAVVEEDLEHEPTIEEYAAWWKQSAATAYREQALFRECFPNEASPSALINLAHAQGAEADLASFGRVQYSAA